MRVYIIPAQAMHHAYDTEGNLYNLQVMVGGFIETCAPVELRQRGIELLCNEEGLLAQLPVNINMFPYFFVGTLVAVGVSGEDFVSLTPDQESFLKKWLESLP